MTYTKREKRAHQRRSLQVPVICYPSERRCELQSWIFGKTVDVGMDGLRIRFRGVCLLEPGTALELFVLDPDGQGLTSQKDVPVCIRAQVSWIEKEQRVFGVEYLQ